MNPSTFSEVFITIDEYDNLQIRPSDERTISKLFVCLFCYFKSQSTAMVMAGRSVHLSTLFLGKLEQEVNQYLVHILSFVTDNNPS